MNLKDGQLVALQTIWSQYARRSLDVPREHDRNERLRWASENTGREITSFKDLTRDEAAKLIDTLQLSLGNEPKNRPRTRAQGRTAGTEGRRGRERQVTLAGQDDIKRIQDAVQRLGWDTARFEAWLRSPSSPLGKTSNPQIRTVADANRVWWGLKRLLQRAGLWNKQHQGNK